MKKLREMNLEELWQLFPIELKAHNERYAGWYAEEQRQLLALMQAQPIERISHIGSTAVEDLLAKPIIDILMELPKQYQLYNVKTLLEQAGWLVMASDSAAYTIDCNKGYTPQGFAEKVFHLHVKEVGDWGELYFRDYLSQHPDIAQEYAQLKQGLKEKYEHNRDAYTEAKSEFVKKYTELARQEYAQRYFPK